MSRIRGKEIKTEVDLVMSRTSGSADEFMLQVTDKRSRTVLLDIRLKPWQIANLMSTRRAEGTASYFRHLATGRYLEIKTINVPIDDKTLQGEAIIDMADRFVKKAWPGWELDVGQHKYSHMKRQVLGEIAVYEVTIVRFVAERPTEVYKAFS